MRRRQAKQHRILPDPKFNEVLITKFVNNMMVSGKKNLAYQIFYDAMDIIQEKMKDENPVEVFKKGLDNVTPGVEVRSRRVGGATFQIPTPVRDSRKQSMAIKWMIRYARDRRDKTMALKLANEFMAAFNEEGAAFKKKEDTHRMADANKAFSHFRF